MTYPSNIGSFETLNPFVRCGFKPASVRSAGNRSPGSISDPPYPPTLDGEIPIASAISERLQCVALGMGHCANAHHRRRIQQRPQPLQPLHKAFQDQHSQVASMFLNRLGCIGEKHPDAGGAPRRQNAACCRRRPAHANSRWSKLGEANLAAVAMESHCATTRQGLRCRHAVSQGRHS